MYLMKLKAHILGQRDCTEGKAIILNSADIGLFTGIVYGPLSIAMSDS